MHRKPATLRLALGAALITLLALCAPALAQEEGGYKETFDDPSLPGWEHAREAIVVDGVLKMSPGTFAIRFGDWSDITLSVKMRTTGTGEVVVQYYVRDEERYGLVFTGDNLILAREEDRSSAPLATAEAAGITLDTWTDLRIVVSSGEHQVYIDDALVLTATDPEPLSGGAVMFMAHGKLTAEFDDLELKGTAAGPLPGPGEPSPEEGTPPEGEPLVGEEPPPGGETGAPPPAGGVTGAPTAGDTGGTDSIIDEFFASQADNLELTTFAINIVLSVICAYILSLVYVHWGSSLTNRRKFAANFMLMTVTTTFIILVVRSSVALSLGLVGALSIVRFRTAVKEPEELAYLFFAIGLGIGLGDNQRLITLLALAAGVVIIGLHRMFRKSQADVNLHLTVASHNPAKLQLDQIMEALKAHTSKLKLLRFDENPETLEASFLVEFRKVSNLNKAKAALQTLSDSVEITFLDNKGIW